MKQSALHIVGIPFDQKSSYLRGCALGPSMVRQALHSGSSTYQSESGVDLIEDLRATDHGDLKCSSYAQLAPEISKVLSSEAPTIFIGGDHSITYPIIQNVSAAHQDITILHFDAHTDLYDEFEGDRYSHACPFARIMEEKLASRLVQVGIRTINAHQKKQIERFGVEVISMRELGKVSQLKISGKVYLSLDLDVFDPAFAPGVSHYESGGLTPREFINLLHTLEIDLIGADIVELNPTRDHRDQTAFLAAKCLKEIAALVK